MNEEQHDKEKADLQKRGWERWGWVTIKGQKREMWVAPSDAR